MSVARQVQDHEPIMVAWNRYKATDDYQNSRKWAQSAENLEGSLWAMFMSGWLMATERAAAIHEDINPASDSERLDHLPGAGAMGAVIEYRDAIRKLLP